MDPPEVTLSGSGTSVEGTSYMLNCTVVPPTGVQFDHNRFPPNIMWPGLNIVRRKLKSSHDGFISSITLHLLQNHSREYSCSASYRLGGVTSEVVTDKMNITVISEL